MALSAVAILPAPPRLSWNNYIVTGFPYKITPQSLLISFQIYADTFSEAGPRPGAPLRIAVPGLPLLA
jgi:hypothetical protein